MTNPIRQSIALDGASDVQRQFADIGDAGTRAFGAIKQAASDTGRSFDLFRSVGQWFRDAISEAQKFGEALKENIEPIRQIAAEVPKIGAGFAGVIGIVAALEQGFNQLGNEGGKTLSDLGKAADKANKSVENFQKDRFGAIASNLDPSAVTEGFKKLSDAMSGAAGKTGTAASAQRQAREQEIEVAKAQIELNQAQTRTTEQLAGARTTAARAGLAGEQSGVDLQLKRLELQERELKLEDAKHSDNASGPKFVTVPDKGLDAFASHAGATTKLYGDIGVEIVKMGDAADKSASVFDRLGVSVQGFDGSAEEARKKALEISDALARIPEGVAKDKIVDDLGKAIGTDFVDYLQKGRDAIAGFGDDAAKLGPIASEHLIDIGKAQQASLGELTDTLDRYRTEIQALFVPATTNAQNTVLNFIRDHRAAIEGFISDVVKPAVTWLSDFRNAAGTAAIAIGGIGAALGLLSPITALGVAGAGLATLGFTNDLRKEFGEAFDFIKKAAASAYAYLKQQALTAFPGLAGVWNVVENAARQAWAGILDAGREFFSWLAAHADEIAQLLSAAWRAFVPVARAAWAEIKTVSAEFYEWFKGQANAGFPAFKAAWEDIKATVLGAFDIFKAFGTGIAGVMNKADAASNQFLGTNLPTHLNAASVALAALAAKFLGLNPDLQLVTSGISVFGELLSVIGGALSVFAAITGGLVVAFGGWGLVIAVVIAALPILAYEIYQHWDSIKAYIDGKLDAIKEAALGAWHAIGNAFADAANFIRDEFVAAIDFVAGLIDSLVSKIEGALARLKSLVGFGASAATSGDTAGAGSGAGGTIGDAASAGAFASGGSVRGAGTSTSDSILARLSNGEFVMSARAVSHWGAGAMHAMNNLRGFADGGLVDAFAAPSPGADPSGSPQAPSQTSRILSDAGELRQALRWAAEAIGQIAKEVQKMTASFTGAVPGLSTLSAKIVELGNGGAQAGAQAAAAANNARGAFATLGAAASKAANDVHGVAAKFVSVSDTLKDVAAPVKQVLGAVQGFITADPALLKKYANMKRAVEEDHGSDPGDTVTVDQGYDPGVTVDYGSDPYATGGHVRGPGSGTSDSILARVSNGEYVPTPKTVARMGVGFFDALNSFAEGGLVGRLGSFAMGGLIQAFAVPSPIPAFAGGGFVERSSTPQGRAVNIHIGGKAYPLLGRGDVVDDLERASRSQQLAQAGAAPSWVR